MNGSGVFNPGQIDIIECKIFTHSGKSINLIENSMVSELSLHEDIFSSSLSGFVVVVDTIDMLSNFPMTGDEYLSLVVKTPDLKTEIREIFHVYKMQARENNLRRSNYILNFCSVEQIVSENTTVSKYFSGKISDTVSSIFADKRYLGSRKNMYVEPTANNLECIPANWSPIKTINWLASKAISKEGYSDYLFFQTNQTYEFVPLSLLIKAKPEREYIYRDIDSTTAMGNDGNTEEKYKTVESISQPVTYDYLKSTNAGMYDSQLYTFDITTRQIKASTLEYFDYFKKGEHLNDNPMMKPDFVRGSSANITFIEKNNYLFGKNKPFNYHTSVLQRASSFAQLNSFKLTIKVHGRTDIKAGNTIKLTVTDFRQIDESEISDRSGISDYYSGKYLVTAIRHIITGGNLHEMYMEVVKDSFIDQL
jgi:hypothetical protein